MYLFYRESFVAGNRGYASAIVVWTVLLIGAVTACSSGDRRSGSTMKFRMEGNYEITGDKPRY